VFFFILLMLAGCSKLVILYFMSDISFTTIELAEEKAARVALFGEIEQEALRIGYECAENPIGSVPQEFGGNIIGYLLLDNDEYQSRPVNWRTAHAYCKGDVLEAAVVYETQAKNYGHYYRLRTVSVANADSDPIIQLNDFAIKTAPPRRSICWSLATLALDKSRPEVIKHEHSNGFDYREQGLKLHYADPLRWAHDLVPDPLQAHSNEDFVVARGRLLQIATILGKLSRKTLIQDLADLPVPLQQPIAYPLYHNIHGVGIANTELAIFSINERAKIREYYQKYNPSRLSEFDSRS
jgi:hypothetical protein